MDFGYPMSIFSSPHAVPLFVIPSRPHTKGQIPNYGVSHGCKLAGHERHHQNRSRDSGHICPIAGGAPVGPRLADTALKEEASRYSRRCKERLQHPDFAAVERHFGHPLPACVQTLYANQQELMRGDFLVAASIDAAPETRWYIGFYMPADEESLRDAWPGLEKYFAFADDGSGDRYLIDPKEEDPPVLFHDHETGEISHVCDQFTEFMKWPRFKS